MLSNIIKVLKNPNSFLIWFLSFSVISILWYIYSDIEYVIGNYSRIYAYTDLIFSLIAILIFPFIIAGIVYRSLLFGRNISIEKKSGFLGVISGVLAVFINGSVCCGVSLLSLLGLTSIISFLSVFPYDGLEVKGISILLLIYSFIDLYTKLEVCKIKNTSK